MLKEFVDFYFENHIGETKQVKLLTTKGVLSSVGLRSFTKILSNATVEARKITPGLYMYLPNLDTITYDELSKVKDMKMLTFLGAHTKGKLNLRALSDAMTRHEYFMRNYGSWIAHQPGLYMITPHNSVKNMRGPKKINNFSVKLSGISEKSTISKALENRELSVIELFGEDPSPFLRFLLLGSYKIQEEAAKNSKCTFIPEFLHRVDMDVLRKFFEDKGFRLGSYKSTIDNEIIKRDEVFDCDDVSYYNNRLCVERTNKLDKIFEKCS